MMPLESYERTNIKVYLAHMLWKKKNHRMGRTIQLKREMMLITLTCLHIH